MPECLAILRLTFYSQPTAGIVDCTHTLADIGHVPCHNAHSPSMTWFCTLNISHYVLSLDMFDNVLLQADTDLAMLMLEASSTASEAAHRLDAVRANAAATQQVGHATMF